METCQHYLTILPETDFGNILIHKPQSLSVGAFFIAQNNREQSKGTHMATAGRKMGTRHQEDVRKKIQASQIINRLQQAFNGEVELTATQVNIAKTLLDKSLPSLMATEISGTGEDGEIKNTLTVNFIQTEPK